MIENADLGLAVSEGSVGFRGSFVGDSRDITSCDWLDTETTCTVDAAYSYWGSDTGPDQSVPDVCGAVTTSPWLNADGSTNSGSSSLFASPNCDGSATPDQVLAQDEQAYTQQLSELQEECDADPQDCQLFEQMQACNSAAVGLAESQSSFSYSNPDPTDVVDSVASGLADAASEVISGVGEVIGHALAIVGGVGDILDLAQAFVSCPA